MKAKLICLMAGIMAALAIQSLQAEEKPNRPSREELREKFQNLSPEEREAKRKEFAARRGEEMKRAVTELGLKPEELKNLSEEERRAKIKEAADKKLVELQKKKSDGKLTDSEKQMLQRLEHRKKLMENDRQGRTRGPGLLPRKPANK